MVLEFSVPDVDIGGDGIGYIIEFSNGERSIWLRTSGLYVEYTKVSFEQQIMREAVQWTDDQKLALRLLSEAPAAGGENSRILG